MMNFEKLWVKKEIEVRVNAYKSDYYDYRYALVDKGIEPEAQLPFYTILSNSLRLLSCAALFFAIIFGVLSIVAYFTNGPWLFLLMLSICLCLVAYGSIFPENYWNCRREFHKIQVLRFLSDEAMSRFDRDFKALETIMAPYKAKWAEEEAERKAKEKNQQQAKIEQEARAKEEAKNKFRPQFMALLNYVQTNFKIFTPFPEKYEGKFTILLPNKDWKLEECAFDYSEEEVERLIVRLADPKFNSFMKNYVKLHTLVATASSTNSALQSCN